MYHQSVKIICADFYQSVDKTLTRKPCKETGKCSYAEANDYTIGYSFSKTSYCSYYDYSATTSWHHRKPLEMHDLGWAELHHRGNAFAKHLANQSYHL
jgi:hypothetical protein